MMNNDLMFILVIVIIICLLKSYYPNMDYCQLIMISILAYVIYYVYNMNLEQFTNYNGSYSGYVNKTDCKHSWKSEPCDTELNDTMGFTQFGSSVPLNATDNSLSDQHSNYPSVDGISDKNSMFMFSYNKASPDCCPSSYSTSTGCVCTNTEQRDYVKKRGGNNTSYSNNF